MAIGSLPPGIQDAFNEFLGEVVILRDEPSAAQVNAVRKINRKTKKAFRSGRSPAKCLGDIAKVVKITGGHFDDGDIAVPISRDDLVRAILADFVSTNSLQQMSVAGFSPKPKNADRILEKIDTGLQVVDSLLDPDNSPFGVDIDPADANDALDALKRVLKLQTKLSRKISKAQK